MGWSGMPRGLQRGEPLPCEDDRERIEERAREREERVRRRELARAAVGHHETYQEHRGQEHPRRCRLARPGLRDQRLVKDDVSNASR